MKRFLYIVFFLLLAAEAPSAYGAYWHLPFGLVYELLFDWKPLRAPFIDIFSLIIVLSSPRLRVQPDPVRGAIFLSTVSLALWSAYGIAAGGSAYQVQFQIHALAASYLFCVACRRALHTPDDFLMLGTTFVRAALYRALMCIAFYALVLRENVLNPQPQFITSHDDSVLFVVALVAQWIFFVHFPSPERRRKVLWSSAAILVAIYLNNRRLAWVSLIGALCMMYAAMPRDGIRRALRHHGMRIGPVIALYVLVGWGRPEAIFAPLRSLSSVTNSQDDASTRSRDAENAGLIFTLKENPVLGTGWGREYIELDSTLAARDFTQYRYVPHNSVLGLLAFGGCLGFAGFWAVLPTCAYVASRAARYARDPTLRCFGLVILIALVAVMNQMYGDMGAFTYTTTFTLAAAAACASHLLAFEPALLVLQQPRVSTPSPRVTT